jgi:hypothetical protein
MTSDETFPVWGKWRCPRCGGSGWLEPIGPRSDDSYITCRPCPRCHATGYTVARLPASGKE